MVAMVYKTATIIWSVIDWSHTMAFGLLTARTRIIFIFNLIQTMESDDQTKPPQVDNPVKDI